jgi:hypothetical protein
MIRLPTVIPVRFESWVHNEDIELIVGLISS